MKVCRCVLHVGAVLTLGRLFQEIRNRHWLQVMSVTGSSFQLEAHIFKLVQLLDIGLLQ